MKTRDVAKAGKDIYSVSSLSRPQAPFMHFSLFTPLGLRQVQPHHFLGPGLFRGAGELI